MADEQLIKPRELPAAITVFADDAIMTDDGVTVAKATPVQIVDAGAPVPSESEAIAGVNNSKRMTPLTVRQVLDNTSAPAVLRAQAWAESTTTPDPSMPGSKSSRTWALEAAQSASDAEDAASTAATDAANLITATMQGYVDSASGSASAAATSEENAVISAGQAATSAGQAVTAMAGSVRFDQAQTLTAAQKLRVWNNIAGARLHAANGYETLPDGLIVQWGIAVIPAGGFGAITFPLAFPNNCFQVFVSPTDDPTLAYAISPTARVMSRTQFYAVGSVIGSGGVINFEQYNIGFYAVGN